MSAQLPDLTQEEIEARLARASPVVLTPVALDALFAHYQELRRWNAALSLVGPGTAAEIVERHYAESLEGVKLIPPTARTLVDVGSGAGFPGFVLAAALPRLAVTLVEPRQRRWSFLMSACRRAALPCRCLNARVESPLPPGLPERIDVVTTRALKLPAQAFEAVAERFDADSKVLIWAGEVDPEVPSSLVVRGFRPVPGSRHRRIVELAPAATGD